MLRNGQPLYPSRTHNIQKLDENLKIKYMMYFNKHCTAVALRIHELTARVKQTKSSRRKVHAIDFAARDC